MADSKPSLPRLGPSSPQTSISFPIGQSECQLRLFVSRGHGNMAATVECGPGDNTSGNSMSLKKALSTTSPLALKIVAECPVTKARACDMTLPHCAVSTPVFMPVGTQGTLKGITVDQLDSLGCQICLGNTYHLGMRPVGDLPCSVSNFNLFCNVFSCTVCFSFCTESRHISNSTLFLSATLFDSFCFKVRPCLHWHIHYFFFLRKFFMRTSFYFGLYFYLVYSFMTLTLCSNFYLSF